MHFDCLSCRIIHRQVSGGWGELKSPHPFSFYSLCYFSSLFSKRLEHPGDTLFLLFHVRVNIEIKGCCNIGMTEQYAYYLVVAVAFYAACRKVVVRSVTINQVKQELNATSKNMQDRLHTMGKNPQKKIVTNCLRILNNVYDCVTKCLLTPFKSVEQSKLHHACLSKKNCSFY